MKKVAIVTDSVACLPQELVQKYGISVVPVSLIFEDRVYRDGVDIKPTEFYELLRRAKKLPTTSPSSPCFLTIALLRVANDRGWGKPY